MMSVLVRMLSSFVQSHALRTVDGSTKVRKKGEKADDTCGGP